jgi:hypothetical protein
MADFASNVPASAARLLGSRNANTGLSAFSLTGNQRVDALDSRSSAAYA